MILISHRGNLSGRLESRENKIDYIEEAIDLGFDVEIDVWFVEGSFFLGHDTAETHIDFSWFEKRKENLWIHAKNAQALEELMSSDLHYFFHEMIWLQLLVKDLFGSTLVINQFAIQLQFYLSFLMTTFFNVVVFVRISFWITKKHEKKITIYKV